MFASLFTMLLRCEWASCEQLWATSEQGQYPANCKGTVYLHRLVSYNIMYYV